ncbi:hypothetical protein [Oceanobacillus kapialis]|uniref:Uncharacterized protein n=1 Tax=Oceanobacillus kapialis TaxID=481353 RepID=A0ABW5Q3Y0_9BACI
MKNITWIRNRKVKNTATIFLLTAVVSLSVLVGCSSQKTSSEKIDSYKDNFEIIGSEREEIIGDISDDTFYKSDRMNKDAKEYHIPAVDDGGEIFSLPDGRYQIAGGITGNVYIYDSQGDVLYHNILGSAYGVPSITLDIQDSYKIEVDSGLDEVTVTPYMQQPSTELSAGIWFVGTDIEAGEYIITGPEEGGFGYLQIIEPDERNQVYEVIGGKLSSSKSKVTLREGQVIKITNIPGVNIKAE